MTDSGKMAILASGGPAPGINSVIGAATIRAAISGVEVVGLLDGFRWLMERDTSKAVPLTIKSIAGIHHRGGSVLGISRANPTHNPQHLANTVAMLQSIGVDRLITIGGDDTALSAMRISEHAAGALHVAHVPKTIDNDLDLPYGIPTFGFQTVRHFGTAIVQNLQVDARTTSRWYFVGAMGRKAGHLALGIGKAAGATLTIIPEEFPEPVVPVGTIVDTLVGSIIKRLSYGRTDGVALVALALVERLAPADRAEFAEADLSDPDALRTAQTRFSSYLKLKVEQELARFGVKATIVAKDLGYELRCADPIPYDMEYTRDLGYCASKFLLEGGTDAMITIQHGEFRPVPFPQLFDPATKKTRVRMVDINTDHYRIARRYMLRLRRDDFEDPHELEKFANTARISVDDFRERFGHLVADEPPPIQFEH
jgi:6-phosphofructokinase